jgi:hypothetical protein
MEWTIKNDPLALSEEVTRPSLKKARHVIDHFAQKVKLHFDDIFVSTVKALYFTVNG